MADRLIGQRIVELTAGQQTFGDASLTKPEGVDGWNWDLNPAGERIRMRLDAETGFSLQLPESRKDFSILAGDNCYIKNLGTEMQIVSPNIAFQGNLSVDNGVVDLSAATGVLVPDGVSSGHAVNMGQLAAVDAAAVHISGDESIDGVKTFIDSPVVPSGVASGEAVNLGQLTAVYASAVHIAGDEDIDGTKTFLDSPFVPAGILAGHAVNKSQLDALNMSGDNLGNHTATENLDMAGFDVTDLHGVTFSDGTLIRQIEDVKGVILEVDSGNPNQMQFVFTQEEGWVIRLPAAIPNMAILSGDDVQLTSDGSTLSLKAVLLRISEDIVLSTGENREIYIEDADVSEGYVGRNLKIRSGNGSSGGTVIIHAGEVNTGSGTGGAMLLRAGDGTAVAGAAGGSVEIRAGNGPAGAGELILRAGDIINAYSGSEGAQGVIIRGGNTDATVSNPTGGSVSIYGGTSGAGAGLAGNVIIGHDGTNNIGRLGVGTSTPNVFIHCKNEGDFVTMFGIENLDTGTSAETVVEIGASGGDIRLHTYSSAFSDGLLTGKQRMEATSELIVDAPQGISFATGGDYSDIHLKILTSGDIELPLRGTGYILKSANSTRYRIKVANDGKLSTEVVV